MTDAALPSVAHPETRLRRLVRHRSHTSFDKPDEGDRLKHPVHVQRNCTDVLGLQARHWLSHAVPMLSQWMLRGCLAFLLHGLHYLFIDLELCGEDWELQNV